MAAVRTHVRLGQRTRAIAEQYAEMLDLSLSAVCTLSLAYLAVRLSPLLVTRRKRKDIVTLIESEFSKIVTEVKQNS